MVKLVGICVALFLLAVGLVIVGQAQDLAQLFGAFRAEPLLGKIAWTLVVAVPIILLPAALWLCDMLVRQGKALSALGQRLETVRQDAKDLVKSQVDAEAAVHHLARTDPEHAVSAVQQRLDEAERIAHVQQNRNEIGDLQSRVDQIRARQQALKERLAPVLDKRRSIEQIFVALDAAQNDLERGLAEITGGDGGTTLDLRLKKLFDFTGFGNARCDEIEQAAKTIAALKQDYSELNTRVAPFVALEDGILRRFNELSQSRDRLATDIESLQRTPEGLLAERLRSLADDKQRLGNEFSHLHIEFSKLAMLRTEIDQLFANLDSALDVFASGEDDDGEADVDTRVGNLSSYITTTHAHFDEVEGRMAIFAELKTRLGELQSRLAPLEAQGTGVVSLVHQVQDVHDALVAKVDRLEADDSGDLAGRVKTFAAAKQDLEERVFVVTEQFSKLATIRKDIAGLFDKLSSAVSSSSN